MLKLFAVILFTLSVAYASPAQKRPYVLVLGTAQDAGVPQMSCDTPFCRRAWNDKKLHDPVSSIALIDPASGGRWIFDATPDLPEQFEAVRKATGDRSARLDGIFLTHAHIGHYAGLMYLGRESMNSKNVRVYAMPRMKSFLEQNAPWSQLVSINNIVLEPLAEERQVKLVNGLSVEPFLVPHRDEFSETVGFRIRSGNKTLIYLPDIDKWQKWATPLNELVRSADHLLLDATFFADGEISRPMSEVPHPFVTETMDLLAGSPSVEKRKVHFIHFNHSNPLIQGDRKAISTVARKGFRIARRGMRFEL